MEKDFLLSLAREITGKPVVISLCDLTGNMVAPWVDHGYAALLVDPQHGTTSLTENVLKIAGTILEAADVIGHLIRTMDVRMVFGFPPCTDVAVSGTRHWAEKRAKDQFFQAKAAIVAEQCRMVGILSGAPWMFENPVSAFSSIFGKPTYTFHPSDFAGYNISDNYTKRTCLWTGNRFVMPQPFRTPDLPEPDKRFIHWMANTPDRANKRSVTPKGFAMAVYLANTTENKIGSLGF